LIKRGTIWNLHHYVSGEESVYRRSLMKKIKTLTEKKKGEGGKGEISKDISKQGA